MGLSLCVSPESRGTGSSPPATLKKQIENGWSLGSGDWTNVSTIDDRLSPSPIVFTRVISFFLYLLMSKFANNGANRSSQQKK